MAEKTAPTRDHTCATDTWPLGSTDSLADLVEGHRGWSAA